MKRLVFIAVLLAAPAFAAVEDPANLEQLRVEAEKGSIDAQYELGVLYEFGFQYPDHRVNAYRWYSQAADQGHVLAIKRRDLLKPNLSASEIERALQLGTTSAPSPAAETPAPAANGEAVPTTPAP